VDSPDTLEPNEPLDDDLREDPTLAQDMRLLASQVRTFAEAEMAFQKARAVYVGGQARTIAMLGVVAATLVFFAAMAAVLGTVIALGPVLGLWGATGAVTLGLLAIALICALIAMVRAKRVKSVLGENDGNA
jgi:hypothetical protein